MSARVCSYPLDELVSRFSTPNFELPPPNYEQMLGEGIHVSDTTIQTIETLMPKILSKQPDDQIDWCRTKHNYTFSLKTAPGLIFKIAALREKMEPGCLPFANNRSTNKHFANMVKAKEVCMSADQQLLVVLGAKQYQAGGISFIAQQKIKVPTTDSAYQFRGLEPALQQLTKFIAKTGFSKIQLAKLPVMVRPLYKGPRRIALLNLAEMEGASKGIVGTQDQPGLIQCLSLQSQINTVVKEALRQKISCQNPTLEQAGKAQIRVVQVQERTKRAQKENEFTQQLNEFYHKNNIAKNAPQPIQIKDWNQLGLDLDETTPITVRSKQTIPRRNGQKISIIKNETEYTTLRKTAEEMIQLINESIRYADVRLPIASQRLVTLAPPTEDSRVNDKRREWFPQILYALKQAGYIFEYHISEQNDQDCYRVQA